MRSRLPLFVSLASSLAFLVSLYLRWVDAQKPALGFGNGGVMGLLNEFSAFSSIDG